MLVSIALCFNCRRSSGSSISHDLGSCVAADVLLFHCMTSWSVRRFSLPADSCSSACSLKLLPPSGALRVLTFKASETSPPPKY